MTKTDVDGGRSKDRQNYKCTYNIQVVVQIQLAVPCWYS